MGSASGASRSLGAAPGRRSVRRTRTEQTALCRSTADAGAQSREQSRWHARRPLGFVPSALARAPAHVNTEEPLRRQHRTLGPLGYRLCCFWIRGNAAMAIDCAVWPSVAPLTTNRLTLGQA